MFSKAKLNESFFYHSIPFTIRIFEKLIKFFSDISCELSSINVKSDKYKPRYGTHGGSTLFK